MTQLPTKEIIEQFENFLLENGQWENFKEFIASKGYQLEEFGMEDE